MTYDKDIVYVKVGGQPYPTYIDKDEVQRFYRNSVLDYMFNHDKTGYKIDWYNQKGMHRQMLDLNALAVAFQKGEFDKRDYAEILMATGYSVSGFAELSQFTDWAIENPLWKDR